MNDTTYVEYVHLLSSDEDEDESEERIGVRCGDALMRPDRATRLTPQHSRRRPAFGATQGIVQQIVRATELYIRRVQFFSPPPPAPPLLLFFFTIADQEWECLLRVGCLVRAHFVSRRRNDWCEIVCMCTYCHCL